MLFSWVGSLKPVYSEMIGDKDYYNMLYTYRPGRARCPNIIKYYEVIFHRQHFT